MKLGPRALASLPPGVEGPRYDRGAVTIGVVHVGVGGFHRAHQAMYLDRLMNAGQAFDWGICGVGLMPGDRRMAQVLGEQAGLYTLVVKHPDGRLEPRVIGSIVDYLFAPDDPQAVVRRMADPATRIVSLTITEGGYNFHPVTGEFVVDAADVQHDVLHPEAPATVFGLVTAALARRRAAGVPPFAVMSCDNIQGNGEVARRSFSAFARLLDGDLGRWVETAVPFPNSMVDRITPGTTDQDRAQLSAEFGLDDGWPVVCEPFTQWVLEDKLPARPLLEDAGVQLVSDVEPYELMKLRLLNASHQALCYFGYLAGYRLVHDVCQDPLFADFLLAYMDREATSSLEPVPGIDLDRYKRELIERFSNASVKDTVARLCAESSDRIPKWLLPVIRHNLATGGPIDLATAVVASWARYATGIDEEGEPIEVVDRLAPQLRAAARDGDPLAFVRNRSLFGDLADDERFAESYRRTLDALRTVGARRTLEQLMATSGR